MASRQLMASTGELLMAARALGSPLRLRMFEALAQEPRADEPLAWFSHGYLDYPFPRNVLRGRKNKSVSVSAGLCSEVPGYGA